MSFLCFNTFRLFSVALRMKSDLFSVKHKDLPDLASADLINLAAYFPATEFIHTL